MTVEALHRRFYADAKYNGTQGFYDWVRQYTSPQARLLNLGAGPPTLSPIRVFKGEVAEVVGADVDRQVLANPELDSAVLIKDGRLPFADASFDLALSDYVLEHVEHPALFLSELHRVLKPGGHFFFRTPNSCHYVALVPWLRRQQGAGKTIRFAGAVANFLPHEQPQGLDGGGAPGRFCRCRAADGRSRPVLSAFQFAHLSGRNRLRTHGQFQRDICRAAGQYFWAADKVALAARFGGSWGGCTLGEYIW